MESKRESRKSVKAHHNDDDDIYIMYILRAIALIQIKNHKFYYFYQQGGLVSLALEK